MSKQVYISADYAEKSGDIEVVNKLNQWARDDLHKVDFIDMSDAASGSVTKNFDCRICDLKNEFNRQINASSAVIFIVGDKTASREAGSSCERNTKSQYDCWCTPYKQNTKGRVSCKVSFTAESSVDVGCINSFSYLRHEFEQAKKRNKNIIILYNSSRKESNWLPNYMSEYESIARPFWINNFMGVRDGNYKVIKEALGYV